MLKMLNKTHVIKNKIESQFTEKIKKILALSFLLLPALIIFTFFVIYPVIQALYYSAFKWNGLGGAPTNIVGFNNLIKLLNDPVFYTALRNNFIIIGFSLLFQLPSALLLALIIGRKSFKGSIVFRAIFFLPFIFSEILTGVIWRFIYHQRYGLLQFIQSSLFPSEQYTDLLSSPDTVFIGILIVLFWKYFGFHLIIYIAGLQSIPPELNEAATIDGASTFQVARYITIPLLMPSIKISVFLSIIGALQVFDIVWAMGRGDPVHAAETLVTYMYKFGFIRFKLGYGSTIAIVIFIICVVFNIIYQKKIMNRGIGSLSE